MGVRERRPVVVRFRYRGIRRQLYHHSRRLLYIWFCEPQGGLYSHSSGRCCHSGKPVTRRIHFAPLAVPLHEAPTCNDGKLILRPLSDRCICSS